MNAPKAQPETEWNAELNSASRQEPRGQNESASETAQVGVGAEAGPPSSEASAGSVTLSAEEFEALRRKADQAAEHWERLLRTAADFDNFRKRAARERQELQDYAQQALLLRLIPVLDSFEAALAAMNSRDAQSVEKLQQGVQLVWQQLRAVLQDVGLTEVDATGQPFDPALHEAMAMEERSDLPEGQVVRQLRKGYRLRDRLLRPAGVVVAHRPAEKTEPPAQ